MVELAQALRSVSDGVCRPIAGHQPTVPLVAYPDDARDARGMRIDHRARVTSGILKVAQADVLVHWCVCTLSGSGVSDIEVISQRIAADRASKILSVLNAGGWQEDQAGVFVGHYGSHTAYVWQDDEHQGWSYCVNDGEANTVNSRSEAMRGCASRISQL